MSDHIERMEDVCALPLVHRVAATLDLDPARYRNGDPLPRGWHVCLFTVPTRQSQLRPDGAAGLGVTLPDVGLPRLMIGGRRIRFTGDIPIGAAVRRESRRKAVIEGGALRPLRHRHDPARRLRRRRVARGDRGGAGLRDARSGRCAGAVGTKGTQEKIDGPSRPSSRTLVPDETLLFRYSAITFNPHRIHYD